MADRGEQRRRSNWLVVIVALVMAIGGLVSMMVLPLLNFFPVIVLAVFGFIAFHHFVWGRWLTKIVREEEGAEEAE
jgi:hypothetical protein